MKVTFTIKYKVKINGYCYNLVSVITFGLAQSDYIMQLLLCCQKTYCERTLPSLIQSAKSMLESLSLCVTFKIHLMMMCSRFRDLCKTTMKIRLFLSAVKMQSVDFMRWFASTSNRSFFDVVLLPRIFNPQIPKLVQ